MIRAVLISIALASSASAEAFVALAYDTRSMVGAAGVADTASAAQDAAMEVCGARAGECKLQLTRADACVALAVDYSSGGWGTWVSPTRSGIDTKVVDHCASFGNKNCTLEIVRCAGNTVESN